MKVLLTGANGFVGSHILDQLLAAGHTPRILLRRTSDTTFIRHSIHRTEVLCGDISDPQSLRQALRGVPCVIHCAGKTKALRVQEYYRVNEHGTHNIVQAANDAAIEHLLLVSSLAANRPGTIESPALETDTPAPVSDYGRSKLAGEVSVRLHCRVPWTILRPAAVFGPRDKDFLSIFKTLRRGIMPLIGGGKLPLSLAYVEDIAAAILHSACRPAAFGRTYHLAAATPLHTHEFLARIAAVMHRRTLRFPVPLAALLPLALGAECLARLTRKPHILSRQKIAEMRVPGWVCSTAAAHHDLHLTDTPLDDAIKRTTTWYEQAEWF